MVEHRGAPLYANVPMQTLLKVVGSLGPEGYETAYALVCTEFSFDRAVEFLRARGTRVSSDVLRQRVHRMQERVDRLLGGGAGFVARGRTRARVVAGAEAEDGAYGWAAAPAEGEEESS